MAVSEDELGLQMDPQKWLCQESVAILARIEPTSLAGRNQMGNLGIRVHEYKFCGHAHRKAGLNSNGIKRWRLMWIRTVELAQPHDPEQYRRLMRFPEDLPDRSRLRPPAGTPSPRASKRAGLRSASEASSRRPPFRCLRSEFQLIRGVAFAHGQATTPVSNDDSHEQGD